VDDCDATVDVALSNDGGNTFPLYEAPAHVRVKSLTTYQEEDQFKIMITQSEIIRMDVAGGSLPTGFMLRESPVLASQGSCSSGVGSSGLFDVSNSFRVYTELSIDAGQSWIPGSSSFYFILGDNPIPVKETTWGSVKAAYR